ncbi:hypothetical protein Rs2_15652 [Raphanus sativus]|nr:hypothetical protein Rs2_15652 [Raphanus sativus]
MYSGSGSPPSFSCRLLVFSLRRCFLVGDRPILPLGSSGFFSSGSAGSDSGRWWLLQHCSCRLCVLSVWKGSLSGPLPLLVWKLVSGCLCWSEEISGSPMYARRQKDDSSEVELSQAVLCVNRLRSRNSLRGSSSVELSLAMLFGCGGCSPACSGESLVNSFFSGGSLDLWWLDDACPARCGVFTRVEAW